MKRFLLLAWMLVMSVPAASAATVADFRGFYEILSPAYPEIPGPHVMIVDNDTLENLWPNHFNGEIPENLVPLKGERFIIMRFSFGGNRFLLDFEDQATVFPIYLSIGGRPPRKQLELKRSGDGTFEGAFQEGGVVSRFRLAAPQPIRWDEGTRALKKTH